VIDVSSVEFNFLIIIIISHNAKKSEKNSAEGGTSVSEETKNRHSKFRDVFKNSPISLQ
jgi:hypothetical protein